MVQLAFYGVLTAVVAALVTGVRPQWWLGWIAIGFAAIGAWMVWAHAIRECGPREECTPALVLVGVALTWPHC